MFALIRHVFIQNTCILSFLLCVLHVFQKPVGTCEVGCPLPDVFCGRGPSRQKCPRGYYCNIDPADRFAVCCRRKVRTFHYASCRMVNGTCILYVLSLSIARREIISVFTLFYVQF
jgi:hypothetical protein